MHPAKRQVEQCQQQEEQAKASDRQRCVQRVVHGNANVGRPSAGQAEQVQPGESATDRERVQVALQHNWQREILRTVLSVPVLHPVLPVRHHLLQFAVTPLSECGSLLLSCFTHELNCCVFLFSVPDPQRSATEPIQNELCK